MQQIVVSNVGNGAVRIDSADIGQRCIDPNLARIVVQRQNPVDAGAVLRQSVEIVACPAAGPHSVSLVSARNVAVDNRVVADFFNIA